MRTPRKCQIDGIQAFKASPLQRKIVAQPTGCGKTFMGILLATEYKRVLWIAHRQELITQPLRTAKTFFPELRRGVVWNSNNSVSRAFTVASVQTLARPGRLEAYLENPPDLVIVDEAHHSVASSYMSILERCGCFEPWGPQVLGLTATAERSRKTESLGDAFQDIVYYLSIPQAVQDGYLVPARSIKVRLPFDLSRLRVRDGDFERAQLERELDQVKAAEAVALAIAGHARGRKTAIFAISVSQSKRIAALLTGHGFRAKHLDGAMTSTQRSYIVEQLAAGELDAVSNVNVLTEGWDDPGISCVAIARPTKSRLVWIQAVGRGLRTAPGKTDCLIIDTVGASDLGLQTADKIAMAQPPGKGGGLGGGGVDEIARIRSFIKKAQQASVTLVRDAKLYEMSENTYATEIDGAPAMVKKTDKGWVTERAGRVSAPRDTIELAMDKR